MRGWGVWCKLREGSHPSEGDDGVGEGVGRVASDVLPLLDRELLVRRDLPVFQGYPRDSYVYRNVQCFQGGLVFETLVSLSIRLKDLLAPVTRVTRKKKNIVRYQLLLNLSQVPPLL